MFNLFNLLSNNAAKETLSDSARQLLSQQAFTANQPSSIVQDVETFIEFLQLNKVEVSANQNAIAPKYLAELNSRLSHPVTIDFLRPSQKSYPYIFGLYLLLRCSAIAQVQADKKKNILHIDRQVLQSWQQLNDTEKYFNLLATYIFDVDENMINNQRSSFTDWWYVCHAWKHLPKEGLDFGDDFRNQDWLRSVKLHNVALLDLFGFISLRDTKPLKGKGWRLINVEPSAFGSAMMNLLRATSWERGLYPQMEDEEEEKEESVGLDVVVQALTPTEVLQEEFQALDLFPAWINNLELPEQEAKDGVFIFKVSLKSVWRKIAIPASLTLYALSSAILNAFNFDNDHLHQFTYKDRKGFQKSIGHPYAEEEFSTDEVLLRDWQINIGDRLTYVFDFGDWWEFDLVLESIDEFDPNLKEAKLIDQKGKAPEQYPDDDYDEE